ncbi:hypothetical protein HDU92_002256 [Lobulomyces angularis]|nr:hypothetical protein HDU92_002256 [Lobulomyces angularis]
MEEKREFKVQLRTLTPEINQFIKKWEYETPKDVRAGSIKDVVRSYKGNFTKLQKAALNQVIDIPKHAINH